MTRSPMPLALAAAAVLAAVAIGAWLLGGDDALPDAKPGPETDTRTATRPAPPPLAPDPAMPPRRPVRPPAHGAALLVPATVERWETRDDLAAYVRAGMAPDAPVERVLLAAAALTECHGFIRDFDDDSCTEGSFHSLYLCAVSAQCGPVLATGWQIPLSAEEQDIAEAARRWLGHKIVTRGWAALGLR